MEQQFNYFSHEWFSDRLVIFTEGYSMVHRFTIGCVIGDEKILVIDAGLGMTQDLRAAIEAVVGTARPILCACTHGHPDHVGSACLFDEAYCSHKDLGEAAQASAFDPIRRYCDLVDFALESNLVSADCRKRMIPDNRCEFHDIQDGDVFDLGGVLIEAIALPGHSAGSMAFYNRAENYVFTGDAINTDIHLKHLDNEGFRAYQRTLKHFIETVDESATLYPAHLPLPMTMAVVHNLVKICGDIADGNIDHDPQCNGIFHSHQNNRNIRGHYYNNTCVVYDRSLLTQGVEALDPDAVCYYDHEQWTDRVYTITINYSTVNRITLMAFVGNEKVLLIDSGHGIDDRLRAYVEGIVGTDKPILLACTHVGIDHAGGAISFDEVYLHPNDIAKLPLSRGKRLVDAQPFSNYAQEFLEYTVEHMQDPIDPAVVREINDGDVFHLGGMDVECVFTPGHSTGHMAFYCAQERIAFTGDAMNVDTHLKALPADGFREYAAMLERFLHYIAPDTLLFSSHLNRPHAFRVPRNIQAACLEIADGRTAGDPPGEAIQQHIDSFHNPNIRMHYYGNCCVVYDNSLL